VNGDEVRNVKFSPGLYSAAEVNDLLERVAAELDAGRPAGPLIGDELFPQAGSRRSGYDTGEVDWFLDQLRRREDPSEADRLNADPWGDLAADPYCMRREPGDPAVFIIESSLDEYADDWRDFDRQPGTRLSWVRTSRVLRELRTVDQQAIASCRYARRAVFGSGSFGSGIRTLSAGGRTFTMKPVKVSAWPRIAKIISRDRPIAPHMLLRQTDKIYPFPLRELLDETGEPVLYTGGSHMRQVAGSYIKFPDQRWLRFPVRGTSRGNAIMTAVDQEGNKVARYRFTGAGKEIAVHPDERLTEELALVIAVSATWISDYCIQPADYHVSEMGWDYAGPP
jgi:DivIVA domain-containing protein